MNDTKPAVQSLTIWGLVIWVIGAWFPEAASTMSDPDFWEIIRLNLGNVLESLGILLSGFGIRRRLGGGIEGLFK